MEKIIWTDRARNEEMLHGAKEGRNVLHTAKRNGHILCTSCFYNTLLKEREMKKVTGRRRRRGKQLLD